MRAQYPFHNVDRITDLKDLLEKSCQRFAKKSALQWKEGGKYHSMTYKELYQNVEILATALTQLGMQPDDKVAVLGENRPEWTITYLAVTCSGVTCLPIDKDLRSQEIFHLLYFCEVKFIIASEKYIPDLVPMQPRLPSLKSVICMDKNSELTNIEYFSNLLDKGRRAVKKSNSPFWEKKMALIRREARSCFSA